MELTNTRKLPQDAQESLRLRAIKMVLRDVKTRTDVAALLGVSRYAVNCWAAKYQHGGKEAVVSNPRK